MTIATTTAADAPQIVAPARSRTAMARGVAGYAILAAILAGLLLGALSAHRAGWGLISVHGGSMGDTIPIGSIVIARAMPAADVSVGDVIMIKETADDGTPLAPKLHRIVSMETKDGQVVVKTKGDGNNDIDPTETILRESTLVAQSHVPQVGYWLSFLRTPAGWLLTAAIPFSVVALMMVASIWRKKPAPD